MIRNIVLTGGTGFLGSHLLAALVKQGYQVSLLKRTSSDTWRIKHLLKYIEVYDVDKMGVERAFLDNSITEVIHVACNYGRRGEDIIDIVDTNIIFGLQLLNAAKKHGTKTFVNTDTVLPKYLNAYSLSKKQFSEWLYEGCKEIQVINLKLEHMYGPKDDNTKFVPWLITQLEQNVERIALTKGNQLRDFIYIDDVVSAYMLTLQKSHLLPAFTEFDVGTGDLMSVRDFATEIERAYKNLCVECRTKLGFGELPLRDGEVMTVELDNSKLRELGWVPQYSASEGIKRLYERIT